MHCYLTKTQAFPLVFGISSRPKCYKLSQTFKTQSFLNASHQNVSENFTGLGFGSLSNGLRIRGASNPRIFSCWSSQNCLEDDSWVVRKPRKISKGFHLINAFQKSTVVKTRNFSNWTPHSSRKGYNHEARAEKTLPWIAAYKDKEAKGLERAQSEKSSHSSWEDSANSFFLRNGTPMEDRKSRSRSRTVDMDENHNIIEGDEANEAENEDSEVVDDPRWDKIKSRYQRITTTGAGSGRPDVHRWNKQESWGRKTWKEATESTLPKMIGEGIYGVGPVLAALSAGRREFYALYLQEGLDLSSNNRKKKDKKGFEKVLKIAKKLGLSKKEVSKHDLNMIVDNRPHQGLVLDASPLELVNIRELDPILSEKERGPLWVALDEVTDPQNLGAIIRSSYFFGVSGVVLCAKNSAPLSGVVSKASAGSLELMELRSCKNMMQFLTSSSENGWRVLGGSVSSRALPLNEVHAGIPTILVLGSEGTGLRPLVERSCTQLIKIPGNIPMDTSTGEVENGEEEIDLGVSGEQFRSFLAVESLNVSVAAGVLLHHLVGNDNQCT